MRYREYEQKNKEKKKKNRVIWSRNNREKERSANKLYRLRHPDRVLLWRIKHRSVNRHNILLTSIKKSCKKNNLEFNLTKEWVLERFNNGICELSGIKFDMNERRSKNSPSVDRINPTGGYTIDNCRMITWALNRALCNYGQEYFLNIFENILRKMKPEIFIPEISPGGQAS